MPTRSIPFSRCFSRNRGGYVRNASIFVKELASPFRYRFPYSVCKLASCHGDGRGKWKLSRSRKRSLESVTHSVKTHAAILFPQVSLSFNKSVHAKSSAFFSRLRTQHLPTSLPRCCLSQPALARTKILHLADGGNYPSRAGPPPRARHQIVHQR